MDPCPYYNISAAFHLAAALNLQHLALVIRTEQCPAPSPPEDTSIPWTVGEESYNTADETSLVFFPSSEQAGGDEILSGLLAKRVWILVRSDLEGMVERSSRLKPRLDSQLFVWTSDEGKLHEVYSVQGGLPVTNSLGSWEEAGGRWRFHGGLDWLGDR